VQGFGMFSVFNYSGFYSGFSTLKKTTYIYAQVFGGLAPLNNNLPIIYHRCLHCLNLDSSIAIVVIIKQRATAPQTGE